MIITNVVSSAIPALPNAVLENIIFHNLSLPDLGACSRVCKVWREMAKKNINDFSHEKSFGPKEWYMYFGVHLRNVTRLPSNIAEIMNSPCPFWPDKKINETHVLIFIPETVNGEPLTLKTLGELVQNPRNGGNKSKYKIFSHGEYVDQPAQAHWTLPTRNVINGSRNKLCEDEEPIVAAYNQKNKIAYEIPNVLDAAVCNMTEYVRSGTWLYGENPFTVTWCQEKYDASFYLVVGVGSDSGLLVASCSRSGEYIGVGCLRKL